MQKKAKKNINDTQQIKNFYIITPLMKKKLIIIFSIIAIILIVTWLIFYFKPFNIITDNITLKSDWETHIVASIDDDINADTLWCWTFQLIWNDMVNNFVKQDVVFSPQLKIVENLNKQTFTSDELSPNDYYKISALFTKKLKTVIEKWIKEKFNETSDILDQIDWDSAAEKESDYWNYKVLLFYTMLKKVFNFEKEFDELDKWYFDDKYKDIEYFWIDSDSSHKLYSQVNVLYYNSEDDFAVSLITKEWEQIILERGTNKKSFKKTFDEVIKKSEKYSWEKSFWEYDYLTVPKLKLKEIKKFDELTNKEFDWVDNRTYKISDAIQTIEFELDEKWWKIKSEALMHVFSNGMVEHFEEYNQRYFYFDKPFTIFLKEEDKNLPYFAAQISDITLFN